MEQNEAEVLPGDIDFRGFVDHVMRGRYIWYDHCVVMAEVLQRIADDELKRLMVFMPPRFGKSLLVSSLFSAYYLFRHPERNVGLTSYAGSLSNMFSRAARDHYREAGGPLRGDAFAVTNWQTPMGGGVWAAGVGGAITGRGFHLGLCDDPVKNSEDANSLTIQTRNNNWFDSTFWTRREPGAAVIIIQTRWNKRDLAGYILEQEKQSPKEWTIINFEAIKTDAPATFPKTCRVIEDKREVGEPLCPERFSLAELEEIKAANLYNWNTLYQQNPVQREGLVYHSFEDGNIVSRQSLDLSGDEVTFIHAHDFGAVARAWGLFAIIEGKYYLVYDEIVPEGTTKERAKHIQRRIDAIAKGRKVFDGWGGAKGEKQQRRDYTSNGLTIRLPRVTDVETQIDDTNQMFQEKRLFICDNCVLTLDQLRSCIRDANQQIVDKSIWHHLDVLRYLAGGVGRGGKVQTGYGS